MTGERRDLAAPAGAEDRLRSLVFAFYARVRDDELLGPVFEAHLAGRWEAHLERMCDFWSSVLYASGRFRGDPVGTHARLQGVDARHFDRWVSLFEETANDLLPPVEAADLVARSKRMRVVLQRSAQRCPASETRRRPAPNRGAIHG